LHYANDSEKDKVADVQSDIELVNGMEDQENPEQWDVSSGPNVPTLNWPTWK